MRFPRLFMFISSAVLATFLSGCAMQQSGQKVEQEAAQAEARRQAQAEARRQAQQHERIQVTGARKTQADASTSALMSAPLNSLFDNNDNNEELYRVSAATSKLSPNYATQIFKKYHVNPTVSVAADPVSTFAMDVDSGAYSLARNMLLKGRLPASEGIRIEEFVNAFEYQNHSSDESSDELFSIGAQVFPSPTRQGFQVLHLNIQTQVLSDSERLGNNLVLVADTSGSMGSGNKIQLLQEAFMTLVSQLDKHDSIAIVTYSDEAQVLLEPTPVKNKRKIFNRIKQLEAHGSTNAQAGMLLAYQTAEEMFLPGFNNRVVLTSDGMANSGATDPETIIRQVTESKNKGIFLTTVGVGESMYNDYLLEQLANLGNGHYLYFANSQDIQSAFVDQLAQQLETVAKDAKIQIKFNPNTVSEYRLLGYENRDVPDSEFMSAQTDGGEIGAGHHVSALYEIKLNQASIASADFGSIAIAYKKPLGNKVRFSEKRLALSVQVDDIGKASSDSQLAFIVGAFAEKLRQSYWAQTYDYPDLLKWIKALPQHYQQQTQVKELQTLVINAMQLDDRKLPFEYSAVDFNFDRVPVLD